MDIIRWAINHPVTITVSVLTVVLFGLIGLGAIPIQLTPTVDRPIVTVTTVWPGRSPQEVADDITKEQEKRLKNVTNLKAMRSISQEGLSTITLEFYLGSNVTRALQEVSDALRQVPKYPEEVDEPVIKAAEGAAENAIAWIIIDVDPEKEAAHPGYDIATLFDALDREVKPYVERIDGVAECNIYGGRAREVRALIDPVALAQRSLTYDDVVNALRNQNRNVSGGTIAEGKRDYRVRVVGQYQDAGDVLDTVIAYRDGKPVYVRDVGTAEIGFAKKTDFVRTMGHACLAMNVIRQGGANVMSIMDDLRARLDEVRTDILPRLEGEVGPDLRIRQVYDETVYIHSAIDLVVENVYVGGGLAIAVLLIFLRSFKSTLLIAVAIPISVIGTFLVMLVAGRTLNVISLAGLAFSTGVVVDNAIVVLENIDRRRALGESALTAVYTGSREVWGAVLAATLTHVAVFVPILTVREEAGQIFFDLSLALSVAVLWSLVVAITVIPAFAAVLMRHSRPRPAGEEHRSAVQRLFGLAPLLQRGVDRFGDVIHWMITGWRGWSVRPIVIGAMLVLSVVGSITLIPPVDYLPAGNQNLVFGGLLIPPGISVDAMTEFSRRIESQLDPYLRADITKPEQVAALAPVPRYDAPTPFEPVPIAQAFIGGFQGSMFVGGTSQDPQRVLPVGALITNSMQLIPDAFGGAGQASIFGRGVGGGNEILLEISGPNLDRVISAAGMAFGIAGQMYNFRNVQPNPTNYNLSQIEYRVRLNDTGRRLGVTNVELGTSVRGLIDGAFAGDFRYFGRNIDLKVLPSGGRLEYKELLKDVPVATPSGKVVPLGSVVNIEPARAPQAIQRIEELPSVTIQIKPPQGKTIGEVMDEIRTKIIAPAESAGLIDRTMRVRLEGTAAKLDEVQTSLFGKPPLAGAPRAGWQKGLVYAGYGLMVLGGAAGLWSLWRGTSSRDRVRRSRLFYGALGCTLLGLTFGALFFVFGDQPQLILARFIWALLVTYFLMCALFEDFLYPFVIMFSVPPAAVGGFAALRLVHNWTLAHPERAPQQFDVLTMLGFIILVGTVVSNAILIVEQALNFMHPPEFLDQKPMPALDAIAASVRSRVRPIFMTTCTTLFGGLPLVLKPGAGSEMYRGLGAVVCGGLLVSTLFTLVLVPLVFSFAVQMAEGVRTLRGLGPAGAPAHRARSAAAEDRRAPAPDLAGL